MPRIALALSCLTLGLALGGCTADLRGPTLTDRAPTAEAEARGRDLLARAAEVHGMAAWKSHSTVEYVFRDDWDSALASLMGLEPWDADDLIRMRVVRGGFDGRIDFVDGPRTGEVWGVRGKAYWTREEGMVTINPEDGEGFILRALAYLITLPLRIVDAEKVTYDSEATFQGRIYDRVLATWGSYAPNSSDQYVIWIDRETGRVGLTDFTVRDQGGFLTGRCIFDDHREVGGVLMPFDLTVTDVGKTAVEGYLHRMVIEQAAFDTFAEAALEPGAPKD